jgi:outer membrane protein OmpA-like peptidoglycan-associated protein
MTRAFAFIVWGVIFLIGLSVLLFRFLHPAEMRAVAVRQMRLNHLILPADLQSSDQRVQLIGRYTRSNIVAGQILSANDISSVPLLATDREPLFAVPIHQDLVTTGGVDVATAGKICNKDQPIGDAHVVALFCTVLQETRPCMVLVSSNFDLGPKLKPAESIFLPACGSTNPTAPGSDKGKESEAPPPAPKAVLVTRNFTVLSTGSKVDFSELAKGIVQASLKAGPDQIREVIQGFGDGIHAAKNGIDLASALIDLYRKIGPQHQPLQPPSGVLLDKQVNFEINSTELERGTVDALSQLAEKVRADSADILIEGHADGVGSPAYNRQLSQRRADAVKEFLYEKGVPDNQMHTYGYGQGYFWLPYAPADAANRRVRITECTVAGQDRCRSAPPVEPRSARVGSH